MNTYLSPAIFVFLWLFRCKDEQLPKTLASVLPGEGPSLCFRDTYRAQNKMRGTGLTPDL